MLGRAARISATAVIFWAAATLSPNVLHAQDVPGIEICTVEKTWERRTSCLQSNIEFLHRTMTRLALDHQQKLDAASRQIESLKATIAGLQRTVTDLQAAQARSAEEAKKKADTPAAKEK